MKIAIMAPLVTAIREPQRGGSQAFVSDLARGLAGRGHDVHVYAATGSEIPGVTVIDTGVDPGSLAATLYRAGAAPSGARQLIGDVWEWTSSDFLPYPGFVAWPYKEYSEVFFGPEYKVLRGGSFAVSSVACRGTFRNWDYPIRRQIFSGVRLAWSVDTDAGGCP